MMKFKKDTFKLPAPVQELKKSASGRRLLSKLQKEREIELLQPGNPKFKKVYGRQHKLEAQRHQRQADQTSDYRERKAYDEERSR